MIRLPPRSPRTATLFPYTTLFRSSYVQPGDVVMTLRSTEVLYVDFHVPADVAGRLRTGAVFSASIDGVDAPVDGVRSEEHTSELQSLMRISYAVFCLKKKK